MRYKSFGNMCWDVSVISAGTWQLGGTNWGDVDAARAVEAIRGMVERGVSLVDTAPVYGFGDPGLEDFGFGNAEKLVGKALKGVRDRVRVVTKCGLDYDRALGPRSLCKDMRAEQILAGCEASLRRLDMDYIDLLLVHWPDQKTPLEQIAEAMDHLLRDGRIRAYGLSNFAPEDVLRLHEMLPVGAVQLEYSMVNRVNENQLRMLHDKGIGTMTYGSLGSGILTGAIRTKPDFRPGDTRITFYDYFREPKFTKIQGLLVQMDRIAQSRGVSLSQIAINWSTRKDYIDTAICGVSKLRHVEENCSATNWTLTPEELALLDRAIETLEENEI